MDEIEKLLDLKPLPGPESVRDIFPIFEAAMNDLYPRVPDPEVDYLFTNFGEKVPEERFAEAEKKRPDSSSQLDKALKKRKANIMDLTSDQKDVIEKILSLAEDESVKRLKDKGWEKWNSADWMDAKRKTRVKKENIKELIDLGHMLKGESRNIFKSLIAEENFKMFRGLSKYLFGDQKAISADKSKKDIETMQKITAEILKAHGWSHHAFRKDDSDEVFSVETDVKIEGIEHEIHAQLVKKARTYLFSIWDKEGDNILLMACEGNLGIPGTSGYMVSLAKSRIKSWMRPKNG